MNYLLRNIELVPRIENRIVARFLIGVSWNSIGNKVEFNWIITKPRDYEN